MNARDAKSAKKTNGFFFFAAFADFVFSGVLVLF